MKLSEAIRGIGRPVAYFPALARFLGSVPAAIYLAQLLYWEGKTKHEYLYTDSAEMEEQTALTAREQQRARKLLSDMGIIGADYARLEHKMHITVDTEQLDRLWSRWHMDGAKNRRGGVSMDKRTRGEKGRFVKSPEHHIMAVGKTIKRRSGTPKHGAREDQNMAVDSSDSPKNLLENSLTPPKTADPQGSSGAIAPRGGLDAPLVAKPNREERIEAKRVLLEQQAQQLAGGYSP